MVSRWIALVLVFTFLPIEGESRRKRRTPTHPVVLWSRTVSSASELEPRRVAAFKLSQYTQRIYQSSVIRTLLDCVKDPDLQIKVFCTKAMRNAGRRRDEIKIRNALIERYRMDPSLKNPVIRTWIVREETSPHIQNLLLADLRTAENITDRLALLRYFRRFGSGDDNFIRTLTYLYKKYPDIKTRREVVDTLAEKAKGQTAVVALLADCTRQRQTPLVLSCLAAMESQGRGDKRTWAAIERLIERSDNEIRHATLDLINDLPAGTQYKVAAAILRLLSGNPEPEIQEKAVLALGATGDKGQEVVNTLSRILRDKGKDEATRIAAALSLGQQGVIHRRYPLQLLQECQTSGMTQAFKTACQIGLTELRNASSKAASE